MYFVNPDHYLEFQRLQTLKAAANTALNYVDYCYAYYILSSDNYLRSLLKKFLSPNNGDIDWSAILEPNMITKEYCQTVFFAHQLYSGGWKNENFDFIRLLDDLGGKPEILTVILVASNLYSQNYYNFFDKQIKPQVYVVNHDG